MKLSSVLKEIGNLRSYVWNYRTELLHNARPKMYQQMTSGTGNAHNAPIDVYPKSKPPNELFLFVWTMVLKNSIRIDARL
jgi:hypothetical protein